MFPLRPLKAAVRGFGGCVPAPCRGIREVSVPSRKGYFADAPMATGNWHTLSLSSEFQRWFDAPMTYQELTYALQLIDSKLANAIPELYQLKPINRVPTRDGNWTHQQEPWSAILHRCAGIQTQWSPHCFRSGIAPSAAAYIEARQKHIQQHIDQRRASMQQLLIEVAEAKKHMETSLELPQHLPRYWLTAEPPVASDRGQVPLLAEWEPLADILLSNNVFPFPVVVNWATGGDNSPYAIRGHTHQTDISNAPPYVVLLEKLRKAQEEYTEHTAPELWKIKIRLLERMCKFDSDAALAVKREQEIERMEQEAAAAERAAEQARQRAEAMRDRINSARSGGAE